MKAIILHGGAGKFKSPADYRNHREGIAEALDAGGDTLNEKNNALDAVEAAVMAMENNPVFNCGYGSVLDYHGNVQTDAAVMSSNLSAGGVVNMTGVANPISVARMVMEHTDHVLLGEPGLGDFLEAMHVDTDCNLAAPNRIKEWKELKKKFGNEDFGDFDKNIVHYKRCVRSGDRVQYYSTVGATAIDDAGMMAAATSTGGIRMKIFGRIGDTPLIGSGTYADLFGAASATGEGEKIMQLTLCRMAVLWMQELPAQKAADKAMALADRHKCECGIIGVDKSGNLGYAFNSSDMSWAYVDSTGRREVF